VKIISRIPTPKEYFGPGPRSDWSKFTNAALVEKILAQPAYAVVAEDERNNVIGAPYYWAISPASIM